MLNGMVIFSSSRGQKSVALSSAEAELNALVSSAADATSRGAWSFWWMKW